MSKICIHFTTFLRSEFFVSLLNINQNLCKYGVRICQLCEFRGECLNVNKPRFKSNLLTKK